MKSVILVLSLLALVLADNWAVIVSGSHTYGNYRHHANVCHTYQIMRKNGIPEDNIILFLFDDVAQSPRNPFPNELYNQPGDDSKDVYGGCKFAYTKEQTTADNVLKVLTGEGSGKVLKSGPNDNVFVYYTDHGGKGLVAMPAGGHLYADKLHAALLKMKEKKMYKKLVFYLEACHSGSMWENILEDNLNIYAWSSSTAAESTWGTYCPPQDVVKGKHVGSCLGDEFSVAWMEDSDKADMRTRTIASQLAYVKERVKRSTALEWGQLNIRSDPIGMYQGKWTQVAEQIKKAEIKSKKDILDAHPIDSRDATLHSLYYTYLNTNDETVGKELRENIEARIKADAVFAKIGAGFFDIDMPPKNFDCHRAAVDALENSSFGRYDDYSMKYHGVIVNMCERLPTEEVIARIEQVV